MEATRIIVQKSCFPLKIFPSKHLNKRSLNRSHAVRTWVVTRGRMSVAFHEEKLCCEIDTQTCCPQFSSLRRWEISHFLFHVIWIAQKCCQRMLSVKWLQTLKVLNCAPYLTCFSSESTWLNALPDDWLVSLTIISEVFFCDAKLNF